MSSGATNKSINLLVSTSTVARIRTRYVNEGLDAAISRQPTQRVYERKVDDK